MRERADAEEARRRPDRRCRASSGKRASALVTNMDQPLGRAIGNALEVSESIEILRGQGPADVRELTLALAAEMLVLAGLAPDAANGRTRAEAALASGAALEKFRAIVAAQGGEASVVDDPARLPAAPNVAPCPPRAAVSCMRSTPTRWGSWSSTWAADARARRTRSIPPSASC
jgi:thymidine phosphorylase